MGCGWHVGAIHHTHLPCLDMGDCYVLAVSAVLIHPADRSLFNNIRSSERSGRRYQYP